MKNLDTSGTTESGTPEGHRGAFIVVGVGPGDPELVTLKAARLIRNANVVAYHQGVGKLSNARRIVAALLPTDVVEEVFEYPVTTGETDHPRGYDGAMRDFYDACERSTRAHLEAGENVVLLAEGDPLFYGSAMYLHDRLAGHFETAVIPGIPAFTAATAVAGTPLVRHTDVLTVLPGTLPVPELARRLADTDAAIIMKLGRRFPGVREALEQAGRLEGALYVERASMAEQRFLPVAEVDAESVPYFSLIVVPGDTKPAFPAAEVRERDLPSFTSPEVFVVGLGPGPEDWLTPEASAVLAEVDHVIGYAPYVDRVPQRVGLQRHSSGNTVEVDRARHALDLALNGHKVAVVSGGDAGVFGMASAVFEAAEAPEYASVEIQVVPGVSAVQAVAARAGAPVGADFAVISLSDRLKPWATVEQRVRAIAQVDLVLAVYNPRSRSRTTQVADLRRILLEHKDPQTTVVVGRDIGRSEESLTVTTLADLDPESIDMKCLLIVGASSTRVTQSGRVWTPRFVKTTPDSTIN